MKINSISPNQEFYNTQKVQETKAQEKEVITDKEKKLASKVEEDSKIGSNINIVA